MGRADAERVFKEGGKVILTGRRGQAAEKIAQELGGPDSFIPMGADASCLETMTDVVKKATDAFGGLDAVIACAGTVHLGDVMEMTPESWHKDMVSNWTQRSFLPKLLCLR